MVESSLAVGAVRPAAFFGEAARTAGLLVLLAGASAGGGGGEATTLASASVVAAAWRRATIILGFAGRRALRFPASNFLRTSALASFGRSFMGGRLLVQSQQRSMDVGSTCAGRWRWQAQWSLSSQVVLLCRRMSLLLPSPRVHICTIRARKLEIQTEPVGGTCSVFLWLKPPKGRGPGVDSFPYAGRGPRRDLRRPD